MYKNIDLEDQKLIDAATDVIKRDYREPRHTVGSAVIMCVGKNLYRSKC